MDTLQHSFVLLTHSRSGIVATTKNAKKSVGKRAIAVELRAEFLADVAVFRRMSSADRDALAALCRGRR